MYSFIRRVFLLSKHNLTFIRYNGSKCSEFSERTHTCGELRSENIGERVKLFGWLHFQRMNKFAILRDAFGSTQIIIPEDRSDLISALQSSPLESVVCVEGVVVERPPAQQNQGMLTGTVEVAANDYKIINPAQRKLPFTIKGHKKSKESVRMQYRYLDLRYPEMQRNLRLRASVISSMRKFLEQNAFIEVETPTLYKRTPGGAEEFVVPTEGRGEFYSLVQSPQQLKQMLMVGGVDRYYQLARCYRNEGARPDRQPEFTQLDLEMSFTSEEGVMGLVEGLVAACWPSEQVGVLPRGPPFPRISFQEAFLSYGTDKPDISSPIKIQGVDKSVWSEEDSRDVRLLLVPQGLSELGKIKALVKEAKKKWNITLDVLTDAQEEEGTRLGELRRQLVPRVVSLQQGDVLIVSRHPSTSQNVRGMGEVRSGLVRGAGGVGHFVWVTQFPLLEETEGRLTPTHHPFTQPHPLDLHLLPNQPLAVRGLHYDLVLDGWEVAGGSVRVHDPHLQRRILEMLDIPAESMSHMLEALASGAPPHAGVAFGVDRLIAVMVGAPSIREVIAFPKTVEGRDAVCGAPSPLPASTLAPYHIAVTPPPPAAAVNPHPTAAVNPHSTAAINR